jgi:tripartite-type tricarboxylate transporter receptor subunit TctC
VPAATVNTIQGAFRRVLQEPKVRELLIAGGYDPVGSTPEEFRSFFHGEMKRYADIVREAKIQPE